MSCCGHKRAALRAAFTAAHSAPPTPPPIQLREAVPLRYLRRGSIVVRGAGTGLTYAFPTGSVPLDIDASDAEALLATGRFTRA